MFPHFHLFGFTIHTGSSLIFASFVISYILFYFKLSNKISSLKIFIIALFTASGAFFGARLFHVIFENVDYFIRNPSEVFSNFNGMTFYGAFFSGIFLFYFFTRIFVKKGVIRNQIWDIASICLAMTYGLMRIGCFASGCCWGKITPLPWSVQYYHPSSRMPFKGIPVHPVQMYDSFLGFAIMAFLVYADKRRLFKEGDLIWIFIIFYTIGRFITEFFRGDAFRGDSIFLGLSTSQVISVVLLFLAISRQFVFADKKKV